jgi:ATP-binding protein involved in chromosome partitioning
MSVTQQQIITALKRIRGPDLESNIVDLGLLSEVVIREGRVSFSITVPPDRAEELEPLRQAAQQVTSELPGVVSSLVVLTADRAPGRGGPAAAPARAESPRVAAARAAGAAGGRPAGAAPVAAHSHDHAHAHGHDHGQGHSHGPTPGAAGGRPAGAARGGAAKAGAVAGVKHLIAIASGKGGVGKSTVAVNLALAFRDMGLRVGIMDADIYGPSQAKLLGISGKPTIGANKKLQPLEAYGIRAMSMGLLVDEGQPLVLRGPMVTSALNQMLREFDWPGEGGDLDVLVIDMPPGTGDIQLSLAQQTPLSGAVVVCTPQDLALIDARKGLAMFQKVDVPVLGIVENMSYFLCPKCGERSEIFGHGGAEHEAERIGVPFLGAIPLHIEIRELSDTGKPVVATQPDSPNAKAFREIAANTWAGLIAGKGAAAEPPKLEVAGDKSYLKVSFVGGVSYELSAEMLRVMSPSAEVQGHSPSQRVTVGKKRNVKIKDLRSVGNYAVRIVFDDGHDTGLYSWTYLEELGREKDPRWALYLAELKQKGLSRE